MAYLEYIDNFSLAMVTFIEILFIFYGLLWLLGLHCPVVVCQVETIVEASNVVNVNFA